MISEAALNSKIKSFVNSPKGKKIVDSHVDKLRRDGGVTAGGSKVIGLSDMEAAAGRFIHVLYSTCTDLVREGKMPQSIANIILNADYSTPHKIGNDKYIVYIHFSDLQRESLEQDYKDYGDLDNILALFNNGAHANDFVFGWWNGHGATGDGVLRSGPGSAYAWVRSKKDRESLQFMQQAKSDFLGNYGAEFGNPEVKLGDDYR